MKWDEMKPEDRNRLIAEKIMDWQAKVCDGEVLDGSWGWQCSNCSFSGDWDGHSFDTFIGHQTLPPCYTQSMDAAWQVFQHMMQTYYSTRDEWRGPDYPIFRTFADTLVWFDDRPMAVYGDEIYPSESFFEIVAKWTPENICFAALKAYGIEIE